MEQLTYTSIGLEKSDLMMLDLIAGIFKTSDGRFLENNNAAETADIVFLDVDTMDLGGDVSQTKDGQLLVSLSTNTALRDTEVYYLPKPLRALEVRKLLLRVSSDLQDKTEEKNYELAKVANSSSLLCALRPSVSQGKIEISAPHCPRIFVDREDRFIYVYDNLTRMSNYMTVEKDKININRLDDDNWENLALELFHQKLPLEKTLWQLSFTYSGEELLVSAKENEVFWLNRWPDFGRLKHTSEMMKLATRMVDKGVGLNELMDTWPKEVEQLIGFVNACYLCGWLEVKERLQENRPKVLKKESNYFLQTAVDLIRTRLGFS